MVLNHISVILSKRGKLMLKLIVLLVLLCLGVSNCKLNPKSEVQATGPKPVKEREPINVELPADVRVATEHSVAEGRGDAMEPPIHEQFDRFVPTIATASQHEEPKEDFLLSVSCVWSCDHRLGLFGYYWTWSYISGAGECQSILSCISPKLNCNEEQYRSQRRIETRCVRPHD
jgi:hypothetical protein